MKKSIKTSDVEVFVSAGESGNLNLGGGLSGSDSTTPISLYLYIHTCLLSICLTFSAPDYIIFVILIYKYMFYILN